MIALVNHFGIRMASLGNDFTVFAEVSGLSLAGLTLLFLATARHTHSWSFILSHPGHPAGLPYLGAFAFSSLMSAWTITGFESAANLAEETHQPLRRVPSVILFSEVFAVVIGFLILIGFTLAIPSLNAVQDHPTPLLFIMSRYFSPAVTNLFMLLVFIAMLGSALANITTVSRIVWSMARDGQLPASAWLARTSPRQAPANAIWTVTILASLFVFWARFEFVITGIATLAGYATYAIVVAATLRRRAVGGKREISLSSEVEPGGPGIQLRKSRINAAALVWLLIVLAMLSLPRSAWTNSCATLVAVILGGAWYRWGRNRNHCS